MSSIPPLGRTRSLRQPGSSTTTPGSTSPSRLPMKPPPRPTGTATGSAAATTASSRALARATGATTASTNGSSSTRTRAPTLSSSSRLSGGLAYSDRNSAASTTTIASSSSGARGSRSNSRASPTTGPAYSTTRGAVGGNNNNNSRASPTGSVMSTSSTSTTATTRPPGRTGSTRYPPLSQSAIVSQAGVVGSTTGTTSGRPKSSSGAPSTPGRISRPAGAGHVRAKSTVTTLTKETTLGRPGGAGSNGSSAYGAGGTTTTVTGNTRTTRSQYGHARTLSTDKATVSATVAAGAAGAARPAFNTNQQHYSPLKNHAPKPLTSSFLAPPSPSKLPANVAISAETSRLQTELLQLSLLHRDAQVVKDEWSESAREKLGARFEELANENRQLTQLERRGAEGHNIAALIRWSENDSNIPLDDKIQSLDQVLAGVWALSASEQYSRVTREFEDWAEQVADILAAQRKGSAEDLLDEDDEVCFVSELDSGGWRGDCAGLIRKLGGWQAALRSLGKVPPMLPREDKREEGSGRSARGLARTKTRTLRQQPLPQADGGTEAAQEHQQPSSLEKLLDHCEDLVNDMLSELEIMEQIERDALQSENDWILRVNREFRGGKDPYTDEERPPPRDVIATPATGGTVPLWKMVL